MAVVFSMIPQLGVIGPKSQDIVISFCLGEGESLPELHSRALQSRRNIYLLNDEIGQANNLTGKYILELSKSNHLH